VLETGWWTTVARNNPLPTVRPDVLNPTELVVARLLAAGHALEDIAPRISSSKTAKAHQQAIYRKLGINDRVTFIRWAMRYDLGKA
jgi:DNA-binding NarL/FixJ family response regulator